ncbi:YlmH family RNA-binding protein [Pectinatus haikarae]|uniref:RNA-binding protein YlmH n=1 Tax=Pectinatus haikarae TaxID=349096 RepID=A0ABT9Y5A6_9FIRM|nr:YlmH/Sll1252 family protein [Pectinatus haikarae]MDQ0203012.1 RNA-binding protein YlmH [Pectinatus haikarae]
MADRDKIIRFYKGTEGEEIAVRLIDNIEAVNKTRKFRTSDFLDPYGQEIAETITANYGGIRVEFDGGYIGAERQCAAFIHDDFMGNPLFSLKLINAAWNDKYYHLLHRDVLGALMGLGIDRRNIGDLVINSGGVKIICLDKIAEFIMTNLVSIGSAAVSCTYDDLSSIAAKEERSKEISATVASLRIDSIAAAGYGTSRSKMTSDIEADKLKLNWQSVKNPSQTVKEGDVVSMRGRGRVEVFQIKGKTKKGRIGILLRRYI